MDRRLTPRNAFLAVMAAIFVAFLVLPLVGLIFQVPVSRLGECLADPLVYESLLLTLKTSLLSVVVIAIFGTPVGYLLAKREFRGKQVLDALVDLPLSMPPVVVGFAMLATFTRRGLLGGVMRGLDLNLTYTTWAVIMAQVFVAAPFYVKAARAGFEAVDESLIRASLVLGASRLRTFMKVTLPLSAGGVISGIILAWARAAGEFGATIVFAGNAQGVTRTAPLAVFVCMNEGLSVGATLGTILLVFCFVVLFSARLLLKKSPV